MEYLNPKKLFDMKRGVFYFLLLCRQDKAMTSLFGCIVKHSSYEQYNRFETELRVSERVRLRRSQKKTVGLPLPQALERVDNNKNCV
jgi:hypothetical protein